MWGFRFTSHQAFTDKPATLSKFQIQGQPLSYGVKHAADSTVTPEAKRRTDFRVTVISHFTNQLDCHCARFAEPSPSTLELLRFDVLWNITLVSRVDESMFLFIFTCQEGIR